MSTVPCDFASLAAVRAARRWLIGVNISVVFGLFGMVMPLLGYLQGSRPATPAGVNIPAQSGRELASHRRDRRPGDRHR